MGFLDNFKEAMKRGSEAANNYIERERAKEAAAAGPARHSTSTASRPAASRSTLPEGVSAIALKREEPIECGTKADGTPYLVSCFGEIRFKAKDPAAYAGTDQKEIVRKIVTDILTARLAGTETTINDLKTRMLLPNRIMPDIISALNEEGFDASFKIPLVISPA